MEAAKLDSSARIERYARTTLGMVEPAPSDIQYIVADLDGNDSERKSGDGKRRRMRGRESTATSDGIATSITDSSSLPGAP